MAPGYADIPSTRSIGDLWRQTGELEHAHRGMDLSTICSDPAMCYVSVRPERASYPLIKENMEFTINLTTVEMARATDWAGVKIRT